MSYVAEIHPVEHTVIRVVVAPSVEWCEQNITTQIQTGTEQIDDPELGLIDVPVFTPTFWIETSDPYTEPGTVVYAGPGYGFDPGVPERFVGDEWSLEKATTPDMTTGLYRYRTQGELTWYQGKAWRNLLPDGNPNVFAPPTNWREYPMGLEHPVWVQPSGAFDAYPLDFVVEHEGGVWRSLNPANVWEPGTDPLLWEDITPAPAVQAWVQPSGGHDAYNIGDRAIFEGVVYESVIDANSWSPAVYPQGWVTVEVT